MFSKKSKEEILKEASDLQKQLDEINVEEKKIADAKQKKLNDMKKIQSHEIMQQKMYGRFSSLPVRLWLFYRKYNFDVAPGELEQMIDNFGLRSYFDSIEDKDKKTFTKFTKDGDVVQ